MSDEADRAQTYIINYAERSLDAPDRHQMFTRDLVETAWPATGEQDQRPAGMLGVSRGELTALSLALDGHRSDRGQATAERAQRAFNEHWGKDRQFRVHFHPHEGAYEFHRIK